MIDGMTKFQLILSGVFGFFLLVGILIFAMARPNSGGKANVVVWGSIPQASFSRVLMNIPLNKDNRVQISYKYVRDIDFDTQFIEALARGEGPDVVMIGQDSFLKHRDKLVTVPYSSYTERDFKETFIEEGELFLDEKGVYAFPLVVDPLVLYWNRDIFTSASISNPPQYWDELYELSRVLTQKDGAFNITRATIPFGEYGNVTNSKEIISALMMQAGAPVVSKLSQNRYTAALTSSETQNELVPAVLAMNYYTEFSNAAKPHYTWNRSLPPSQTMFLSGDLALYPGFAGEQSLLRLKNPNLNFGVSPLPQSRDSVRKITFGKLQALSVVRTSKNPSASFIVISGLIQKDAVEAFAKELTLSPSRRDLLAVKQGEASNSVFYESALWSRAWADPDKNATGEIFRDMVESITGGRERSIQSINRANAALQNLIDKINN